MMMFWDGGQVSSWQIAIMSVGMIAFWGVVIWLGYLLIKKVTGGSSTPDEGPGARRILDERLARGEIDADEYSKVRGALDDSPGDKAAVGSPR